MNQRRLLPIAIALLWLTRVPAFAADEAQVVAFYSTDVEQDHVDFARQAILFYTALAKQKGFRFRATTRWQDGLHLTPREAQTVLWLNDAPRTQAERSAFETYMESGGGWIGYHAAGYNDQSTHWPWFVRFLGGAVFYGNNWPPLPALLTVEDTAHPVTVGLPKQFQAPANEWYSWKPDPRADKNVKVLVSLAPANFPLGFKDVLLGGDIPVVWTNTRYRMLYLNMGHGDKIFTDPTQNRLLQNALQWILFPNPRVGKY